MSQIVMVISCKHIQPIYQTELLKAYKKSGNGLTISAYVCSNVLAIG